ncbi:putative sgs1 protein [Rhizophagus irregularis DAOM 181602=DAOM 197198]|nr:putative sgs1 protein [Rhizophagus irregularis DAOM 181602=DAOM 197198]
MCWSDVCWIKDNLELQLQSPTLKNYTQTNIENFRNVIITIFCVPFGQGLVTTLRTSHNEIFNRKILKYLDKRIDYWASYNTRHALAVLGQNDELDVMMAKVYTAATNKDFSYPDMCNILNFVKERSQKVSINHNTIQQRNEARKEKFANDRKELSGFNFDKKLVSYKSKAPEQIHVALWERIVNDKYIPKRLQPELPAYLSGKDMFVFLKTGGGKTLCYALSAICFEGLTIVFSSLKALMDDQKIRMNFVIWISEAWGRLGILKQCWELAPIILLTATCTRSEVNEICANLTIEENNFALIRGSTSHRSEIIFNVRERKEIRDQYVTEIISIINANLFGRIIIYCAIHSSCEYLYNKLQENLADIIVDYFHSGL